jgi:HK97 family phage major capsid protein
MSQVPVTFNSEQHWYDETEISQRCAQLRSYPRPSQIQREELAALERHERRLSHAWQLARRQYGSIGGADPDSGYSRQAAIDQGRAEPPHHGEPWHPQQIAENPSALIRNVRMQLEDDYRRDILPGRACAVLEAGITRTEPQAGLALAEYLAATGSRDYYEAFGRALLDPQRAQWELSDRQRDSMRRALQARALTIGTPASWGPGSYPVPYQVDPTVILTSTGTINPIRQLARVEQIVGREWLGVTSTGVTVVRVAENTPTTDGTPTMAQPAVAAERVQCFVPFSIEVEQDWNGLLAELSTMIADAKDVEEAGDFLTGNGTSPNPQGIVTALVGGSQEITSATTATVVASDVFATEEAIAPRFRVQRQWIGSVPFAVFGRTTQRGNLVNTPLLADMAGDRGAGLMDRPFFEHSGLGSIASTNHVAVVGDWRQFMIVDRIGMSIELVPHIFNTQSVPGPGFPMGQRGVFAMWRNNSICLATNAFATLKVR